VRRPPAGALLAVAAIVATTTFASADDLPDPVSDACTVNRKCSSTGVACDATDAACMSDATSRHLEVLCEDRRSKPVKLVYCPASTGRADSKVIWILLSAAAVLAIGGTALAYVVLPRAVDPEVVDRDDRGVLELPLHARLADEARADLVAVGVRRQHGLQRDLAPDDAVEAEVDLAHPAFAEARADLVAFHARGADRGEVG
jgi:hypothetical protein